MNDRLYLLTIELLGIEPKIWRQFVVPAGISLDRLHDVIQIVMGWKDYHLHDFTIGSKRYTEDPEQKEDGAPEGKYRLVDLVKQKGRTFRYLYDFGDDWQHEITIDDSRYWNPQLQAQVECLAGARACPPEDVGGVPGYFDFCRALLDPAHKDHAGYLEWYAGFPWYSSTFHSESFDLDTVNSSLMTYLRWTRNRYLPWEATR